MRYLITGCAGMLGGTVLARLGADHDTVGVDLPDGDLSRPGTARRLCTEARPDWILHCAGWTDVDGAESAYAEAEAANVTATRNLAGWCAETGCGLTYLSTDYVFDGKGPADGYDEDHFLDPINAYGRTKAGGEEAVRALATPWQIVRTSWLFGDGPVNFPRTIRRLLTERETLRVVDDQRGNPTYAEDLAAVLGFLVSSPARGIFHVTNNGSCTWFEMAQAVAEICGADPGRIHPCSSSEYPTVAARPACSVLKSRRLEEAAGPPRPTWRDALERYLKELEQGRLRFS